MAGEPAVKAPLGWHTGVIDGVDTIPSHWEIEDLCTVARLESGHTPSKRVPEYWEGGEVRWLSLHDTRNMDAHYMFETAQRMTELGIANSSARRLPAGTVALSRTATIGKCVILGQEMATSQDFACYVCGPRVHNVYLMQLFRHMQSTWAALSGGSTHKTIYMPIFERLQVPLPPLPEQQKIAAILSSVDDAIRATEALIEQTRRVKQALLQDLLTRGIGHTRFKTTEIGEIPEAWRATTVQALIDEAGGEIKTGPFGTVLSAAEYSRTGVPMIAVREIRQGYLSVHEDTPRVPPDVVTRLEQFLLRAGDVVFARKGGVDRCAVVPSDSEPMMLGSDAIRLRLSDAVLPAFLGYCLQSPVHMQWMLDQASGSIMSGLNQKIIARIRLALPPLDEQAAIVQLLEAVDVNLRDADASARADARLKSALLSALLTGRVRVSP